MKIGIMGTGHIGKILVQRLSGKAQEVKAVNSRGPRTIDADILSSGGRAVTVQDAVTDVAGRSVLITGGARGIGRAVALRSAAVGAASLCRSLAAIR